MKKTGMKKIIFIFFLLLSISAYNAYADDLFLVEKPDGSVVIVSYVPSSRDTLGDVLKAQGLEGLPIERLEPADLPPDKADRKYWRMNKVPIGPKIKIDTAAKAQDQVLKQQKETARQAVLTKLGITKAEFDSLKGNENGKTK